MPINITQMKRLIQYLLLLFCFIANQALAQTTRPNIIFILADDIGYEIPTVNGGRSYSTPNLDSIARHGMNFRHCEASPLCSPSRFMLLTGKYNFRNYSVWGYVNKDEKTIGNLMKDAGYKTGWFGKLQTYSHDSDIINLGFDEYLVFEELDFALGSRYKNPLLYKTGGTTLPYSFIKDKYADDILTQELLSFIDANKDTSFFAYYPMSLCHIPLSPTPDDPAFASWLPSNKSNVSFFPSMVKYMDKKIGVILNKLKSAGIDNNTLIIFCGDNGTTKGITSSLNGDDFTSEKGATTEAGTHVPLMVYWPGHVAEGSTNDDLIDFTDFFPTLAEAASVSDTHTYGVLDGRSFYRRLLGQAGSPRDWIFCHYDAMLNTKDSVARWIQNKTYKLYDNTGIKSSGQFFNIVNDASEQAPLSQSSLSQEEIRVKNYFLSVLNKMPKPPPRPVLDNTFVENITSSSATVGATIESDGGMPIIETGSLLANFPEIAFYQNNRQPDSAADRGIFKQTRLNLAPQTRYTYSLYARNTHRSNSIGFAIAQNSFYTKSNPPIKQPGSFRAEAGECSINLSWSPAQFPTNGAEQAGYVIIYSYTTPTLAPGYSQKTPKNIAGTGNTFVVGSSVLPALPPLNATIQYLFSNRLYNFLFIPFTWDGENNTYSYLANDALTASATPVACDLGLTVSSSLNQSQLTLTVVGGSQSENVHLRVFDLLGRTVFTINGSTDHVYYTGRNCAPGIYFVQLQQGSVLKTVKVIKGR